MNWYFEVIKKYAVFTGRSRREEFWMFHVVDLILFLVISVIAVNVNNQLQDLIIYFVMFYIFGLFLPRIGVMVRRFHDIGYSGWLSLIVLIPFLGVIVIIVFMSTEGTKGGNKYGPNPKLRVKYVAPE